MAWISLLDAYDNFHLLAAVFRETDLRAPYSSSFKSVSVYSVRVQLLLFLIDNELSFPLLHGHVNRETIIQACYLQVPARSHLYKLSLHSNQISASCGGKFDPKFVTIVHCHIFMHNLEEGTH